MKKSSIVILMATALFTGAQPCQAQKAPEAGYIFPAGGKAGTTVEVHLGGYDWTPDIEFFTLDRRMQIMPTGPLGPILVPPPPYWFGAKGRIPAQPLAREMPARIVLPADLPAGPIAWQAANANGATSAGMFIVGTGPEVIENENRKGPQVLPSLPVTVSGRLIKNEEIDQYRFTAPRDGPITCDLMARRLGARFLGVLQVHDGKGAMIADLAGTGFTDPILTFAARKGTDYIVSISDVDFAGDRSFVYRLTLTDGPRILGTLPAVVQAGSNREVEFVGIGVATGAAKLESVKRKVSFPVGVPPSGGSLHRFEYRLETPFGTTQTYRFFLSDLPESTAFPRQNPKDADFISPGAVTGVLDQPDATDTYSCSWKKGQTWSIALEARRFGSPLDVAVAVRGPDGKELARNDDLPETTDAGLEFTVPADGTYQLVVSDVAGKSGSRAAIYRLSVRQPVSDFTLQTTVQRARVTLGSKFDLQVQVTRKGGYKGPIQLAVQGLPTGVTAPASIMVPAGAVSAVIPLQAAADAGTTAGHLTITGSVNMYLQRASKDGKGATKELPPGSLRPVKGWFFDTPRGAAAGRGGLQPAELRGKKPSTQDAAARARDAGAPTMVRTALAPIITNQAPSSPQENRLPAVFLACTLKPLFKGQPVDADTVPKVHRGSTFPAEVIIDRLDGFQGEITLQMAGTQSYQVQGISGGEVKVPGNVMRTVYPCYMPEWLESSRTSRLGMIGVARVADPKGKLRYVTGEIAGFVTMTMEGALLKVAAEEPDMTVPAGRAFELHLRVSRVTKLTDPARLELRLPEELAGKLKAESVNVAAGQEKVVLRVTQAADLAGLHTISVRATALQDGIYPAISETAITIEFVPAK